MPFGEKSKIVAKQGLTGATGNFYCGLHEFVDMAFLLHFLRKDDVFLDIGANIGSYSILASSEVGTEVYTFEPIPETFEILKRNIQVNKIEGNSHLFNNGVGSQKGVLHFTNSLDTVNHVSKTKDSSSKDLVEVDVLTIDDTVNITKPCLIKIDVEGFETEVLNGMTETLKNENVKAIIIELNGSGNRYGYDENLIHEKLLSLNFKLVTYDPFSRKITNQNRSDLDNKIYVKNIEFVEKRLNEAPKVNINQVKF
jgi:FkbM family methyltransferase